MINLLLLLPVDGRSREREAANMHPTRPCFSYFYYVFLRLAPPLNYYLPSVVSKAYTEINPHLGQVHAFHAIYIFQVAPNLVGWRPC